MQLPHDMCYYQSPTPLTTWHTAGSLECTKGAIRVHLRNDKMRVLTQQFHSNFFLSKEWLPGFVFLEGTTCHFSVLSLSRKWVNYQTALAWKE